MLLSQNQNNFYNAAGQKIKKTVHDTPNNTIKHVDYLDGFQYAGEKLQFFPTSEGYVSATQDGVSIGNPDLYIFNYVYNYTDHLGNIRLSYTKDPVSNELKIMEENHYYPFGLKHDVYASPKQKYELVDNMENTARPTYALKTDYQYKYNGKEYQDELGLNMYDMDMRQYDPAIARWVVMDPVIHHSMSPYNAFDNNPVFWADPSGADSGIPDISSLLNPRDRGWEIAMERFNANRIGHYNGDPPTGDPPIEGPINKDPILLDEAVITFTDKSTFTKWNNHHGGEYDNRIEAYRAWQSESNYHPGESWMDKTFRSMGYASMEARRDFASGGMNMYGGYGRIVKAVESAGSSTKALTSYYPANGGALGKWTTTTLEAGARIDRFGTKFGQYFSPAGTPIPMRALPPGNNGMYNMYEVVKPFQVQSSTVAPWFGKPGTGTQYYSPYFRAFELEEAGYIIKVP